MASIGQIVENENQHNHKPVSFSVLKKFEIKSDRMNYFVGENLLKKFWSVNYRSDFFDDDFIITLVKYLGYNIRNNNYFRFWLKYKISFLLKQLIGENKMLGFIILAIMRSYDEKLKNLQNILIYYPSEDIDENSAGGWNMNEELYYELK
jgi:hypothetical protein